MVRPIANVFSSDDKAEAIQEQHRCAARLRQEGATDRFGVKLEKVKGTWQVNVYGR